MSLTPEQARDEIALLMTMNEEQLFVHLGLQIDRQTQSLGFNPKDTAAAAEPLYGGATPIDDRPGILRRLGQNFLIYLERQFYALICDEKDPDNAKIRSAFSIGADAGAYALAVVITSTFGISFGIATAAATIIAKRVVTAGHGAFCETFRTEPEASANPRRAGKKRDTRTSQGLRKGTDI